MSSCIFCQRQDDIRGRNIYNTCEMSGGKPCGPCTEYFELEAQIEETRKTLEQQLEQRLKIRKKINRIHDTMLVRVPPEITAYIFELAASVDIPPDGSTSLREGELYAPLHLGKVCGEWRDIAWGMPQLWNFIFVEIRTIEDLPLRLDIARQWLSRSGEHLPLSIHLNIDDTEDENGIWDWDQYTPFIGLLNLYSHRWKDLCALGPFFLLERLSAQGRGAPILHRLQLSTTEFMDEMSFNLGCEPLPRPHSIRFDNVCAPDFDIDWGHVTRLETNTFLIDLFIDKFPQLPEMKELRIMGSSIPHNYQIHSVTHLKLESLSIECTNRGERANMCILLNSLTLPSLRYFRINLLQDTNTLRKTISLIQRSSCTLSAISLFCFPRNSYDSLIHLLECANSIEELEFSNISKYDGEFLAALRSRIKDRDNLASNPLPLPNLQHLVYVADVPRINVPWKLLLALFDPSWVINYPQWETLSIFPLSTASDPEPQKLVHKGLDDEVLERLLDIVEAGIELFFPREINKNEILDVMKEKADERAESEAERAELEMMDWEE